MPSARSKRHSARPRTREGLVAGLRALAATVAVVAALVGFVSLFPGSCAHDSGLGPNQIQLESSIVSDRKHLFRGVLTYEDLEEMPVEDTQDLTVTLQAIGEHQDPDVVRTPHGVLAGLRWLRVGGVEEAKLSVRGPADRVEISPVGSTRGLIGKPGDKISWIWEITPKEPGSYTLRLVVVTYQGMSDNPLATLNPPIEIDLSVSDTGRHRFKWITDRIVGLSIILGAVSVILVFFREQIFGPISKRRRRRRREALESVSDTPNIDEAARSMRTKEPDQSS
jgi:hypothetical protein